MSSKKVFAVVITLSLLLFVLPVIASAMPQIPVQIYGSATNASGVDLPVGTEITAELNGETFTYIITEKGKIGEAGSFGKKFLVTSETPSGTIVFKANGLTAKQTVSFVPGEVEKVALVFGDEDVSSTSIAVTGPTSFSGTIVGADGKVIFERAVIVMEGTFPGASSVKITNSSGDGWYNFDISAPGFTGNGSLNFKVPLAVLAAKKMTTSDVGLFHKENNEWVLKPTTYLKSDSQYAYYTGTFDSCSPFKIDFEEGASSGQHGVIRSISISGVATSTEGSTTAFKVTSSDGTTHAHKWIVSDPSVATVDENGNMTSLKSGTVTITVTDDDGCTASKTITVSPKTTTPTTQSPFPILGILAGIGAAAFLLKRRH